MQDIWSESSSVNVVNFAKKNYYNPRNIKFFLEDYFFIGAPLYVSSACVRPMSDTEQS